MEAKFTPAHLRDLNKLFDEFEDFCEHHYCEAGQCPYYYEDKRSNCCKTFMLETLNTAVREPTFKVGDEVLLVDGLEEGKLYRDGKIGGIFYHSFLYFDKPLKIVENDTFDNTYLLDNNYWYHVSMLRRA